MPSDKVLTPEERLEVFRVLGAAAHLAQYPGAFAQLSRLRDAYDALRAERDAADNALSDEKTERQKAEAYARDLRAERDAALAREKALRELADAALTKWGNWHEPPCIDTGIGTPICLGCRIRAALAAAPTEPTP